MNGKWNAYLNTAEQTKTSGTYVCVCCICQWVFTTGETVCSIIFEQHNFRSSYQFKEFPYHTRNLSIVYFCGHAIYCSGITLNEKNHYQT